MKKEPKVIECTFCGCEMMQVLPDRPLRHREIVNLAHQYGLHFKQIAGDIGVSHQGICSCIMKQSKGVVYKKLEPYIRDKVKKILDTKHIFD